MKVLWVEDHAPVQNMLEITSDKAARARVQVDLVIEGSLMAAESRLRLERFDLVILDLTLPDSLDPEMTIARVANMGRHRIGVVSASDDRDEAVSTALRCGVNIAPKAISKGALPFNRFIQRPDAFEDFLLGFLDAGTAASQAAA